MEEKNIVKTVDELEIFCDKNENCKVYATKELDAKINRNISTRLSQPPEDFNLFFKLYGLMDIMAEKGIRYEVLED